MEKIDVNDNGEGEHEFYFLKWIGSKKSFYSMFRDTFFYRLIYRLIIMRI